MYDAIIAETVTVLGAGGDEIQAFLARPLDSAPRGGVIILPHIRGYDGVTKEMACKVAREGYNALIPNLYSREAPGLEGAAAMELAVEKGFPADEQVVGDAAGAATHLRRLTNSNGKVGIIGFCSGGRQAFLAATEIKLDALVNAYGGLIVSVPPPPPGVVPQGNGPIVHKTKDLSCPMLGLFGADDVIPPPSDHEEHARVLDAEGKTYEFHLFPGVSHGFFDVTDPLYNPAVATEGWSKIFEFYGEHLRS